MEDLKCTNCGNQMSAAPKAPQQVSNTPQDAIGYVMENYTEFYAKHGQTVMTPEPESGRIPVYATPPQQQEQSGEDTNIACVVVTESGNAKAFLNKSALSLPAGKYECYYSPSATATASQESAPGQEAVAWNKRKYAENLIRDICEEDEPKEGAYAVMVDLDWLKEFIIDTIPDLYAAPPTSTAIAAMVIRQAAEAVRNVYAKSTQSPDEFGILSDAANAVLALTPANAEAELEALTKSAKRYQILHEHFKFADDSAQEIRFDASITPERSDKPEELDEAIDTAIVRRVLDEKGE